MILLKHGALKGTGLMGQDRPLDAKISSQKTADPCRFTPSHGNSLIRGAHHTAENRRLVEIVAENCRKPQIGVSPLSLAWLKGVFARGCFQHIIPPRSVRGIEEAKHISQKFLLQVFGFRKHVQNLKTLFTLDQKQCLYN